MDIEKYIYSECENPTTLMIYNGITNRYEPKQVPCGQCYHCKITKINEWVTRMTIQSDCSKYVYYGTLTYTGKRPTVYNDDCLSISSNFNKNKTYNDTPLILRKDHVQKFFKRLRKNTNVKIQYAYCGEYGSTYSRPHYHYIIWCNEPISVLDVYKAWSTERKDGKGKCPIGKVEHRDIKNNPDPRYNDPDGTWVYKYVCKYIQKFDFDFEKLTNINQHKKCYYETFKENQYMPAIGKTYYKSQRPDDYICSKNVRTWEDYKKVFSPFFNCSKKPAIGFQYLSENIQRFQNADYRLLGYSKELLFPLYFVRKSKEFLCPLKAQSETNSGQTSYSRLPKMETLLNHIIYAQHIADTTEQIVQLFRYDRHYYSLECNEQLHDLTQLDNHADYSYHRPYYYRFKREYLGLVDVKNKVSYSFRGDHYAMFTTNGDKYIGDVTLEYVKQLISYYYNELKQKVLLPLMAKSEISANKKAALIAELGGIEEFNRQKQLALNNIHGAILKRQNIYKQSKTFE